MPLERDGRIDVWDDRRIQAGDLWREEIERALDAAAVGVLLVSPHFLASRFITEHEVPTLLEAASAAGTRILCLYLQASVADACKYEYVDTTTGEKRTRRLTEFHGLNDLERPLQALTAARCNAALVQAAQTILGAVDRRTAPSAPTGPQVLARPAVADPRPYLTSLRDATRYLDLKGIADERARRIELTRVYTRLHVVPPMDPSDAPARRSRAGKQLALHGEDGQERADLELKDLLAKHAHLVLVGDPGAGKTTFLRFTALNLACAWLNEDRADSLARLGWFGEPAFPVLCGLGAFGQFLETNTSREYPEEAAEQFYRYLDYTCRGYEPDVPGSFLRERVLAGGAMLLLDGLDEVPGDARRQQVSTIVDAVVAQGRVRGNRHLVTCRTRQYQGLAQLGHDFVRATLVDFGAEEIEAFVRQWSCALHGGDPARPDQGPGAAHAATLLEALRAHPHVQPLTTNPLLLTILAVVHWNFARLPEGRAELYKVALERLLTAREKVSLHPVALRRDCLKAIARRMFEGAEGVRAALDRGDAADIVALELGQDAAAALAFVEDEELHSGILVSRREGEVEFWHPTFGEYLTAESLSAEPDYWERVRGHLFDDRWNEVVLLLAGCLRGLGPGRVRGFIGQIVGLSGKLPERARSVGLVWRILRDIAHSGGNPTHGTGYAEALAEMPAIFEPGSTVPERVRVEVGEALGQAGDPRIHEDDLENRVWIEGGTFLMGEQKTNPNGRGYAGDADAAEGPPHEVTLSSHWIDRYPVTVQKYRRFVEAGSEGYRAERFWTAEAWAWLIRGKREAPGNWEDQVAHPNRPVVYVSWYEALAYCAWQSERHAGWRVGLPTEAQWEFAARGPEGRKYPWGSTEPSDRHANFDGRVGVVTPVGIYPQGATAAGVHDLAGNVWEWCTDRFADYKAGAERDPMGPAKGLSRVLRGGAFYDVPRALRSASRRSPHPGNDSHTVGFRCVWLWPGGQK